MAKEKPLNILSRGSTSASLIVLVNFSVYPYHSAFSMACESAYLFFAVLEAKWLFSQTSQSSFLPPDAAFSVVSVGHRQELSW